MEKNNLIEFVLGGLATCGAGLFTNPLEVVKTRMQLQGELKALGQYSIHYRNPFHAFYTIAKTEGIFALQKGLAPALWFQFFMNGSRLGTFQVQVNLGFTKDKMGHSSFLRNLAAGAFAGCVGAIAGSPFYLIKIHLQNQATSDIAVGHQHHHKSMSHAFKTIYSEFGILGLWRGVSGAIPRGTVGSAAQLSTFATSKNLIEGTGIFRPNSWMTTLAASMVGGVAATFFMNPFDVVCTRIYNQPAANKGPLYSGVLDCFWKILRSEGLMGFYKGWLPHYLRLGPHTTIGLVFWDQLRKRYEHWQVPHS